VKDTHAIRRKRATLPSHFPHPTPTSGDFVEKRTLVNEYVLLESIGTGSYAQVRLCKHARTDTLFAMKILKKDLLRRRKKSGFTGHRSAGVHDGTDIEDDDDHRRDDDDDDDDGDTTPGGQKTKLCNPHHPVSPAPPPQSPRTTPPPTTTLRCDRVDRDEIAIMRKLSHPHVLRLYEVMDDPKVNTLYLVLEYMNRGDLMHMVNGDVQKYRCDAVTDGQLWHVFRQVACGLEYLHLKSIVHGDIKPQNLLVGDRGVVKIADFGMSRVLGGSSENDDVDSEESKDRVFFPGTPAFSCPEMWDGEGSASSAADVWAFGATMFTLRIGRPPFVAKGVMQLYYQITYDAIRFPSHVRGRRLLLDTSLETLLRSTLTKDPGRRATLESILRHPWLKCPPRRFDKGRTSADRRRTTKVSMQWENEAEERKPRQLQPFEEKKPLHSTLCSREERRRTASFVDLRSKQAGRERRVHPPTQGGSFDCSSSEIADDDDDRAAADGERAADDGELVAPWAWSDSELDDDAKPVEVNAKPVEVTLAKGPKKNHSPLYQLRSLPNAAALTNAALNESAAVSAAWYSRKGKRLDQEDRVTLVPDLSLLKTVPSPQLGGLAYVGVFDGHGGGLCATFLQHSLHEMIVSQRDFTSNVRGAVSRAFLEANEMACDLLRRHGDDSGATALIALFDSRSRRMLVAHTGDSRCVVSLRDGGAVPLTRDHRVSRPDEHARISAAGGCIVNRRLNGILQVSRSFGDVIHRNASAACQTLSAAPEVTIRNLQPQDELVILASDGLWDAMDSQLAVSFIRHELATHHDVQRAAAAVTQEAIRRGSTDNVTVVLVAVAAFASKILFRESLE